MFNIHRNNEGWNNVLENFLAHHVQDYIETAKPQWDSIGFGSVLIKKKWWQHPVCGVFICDMQRFFGTYKNTTK